MVTLKMKISQSTHNDNDTRIIAVSINQSYVNVTYVMKIQCQRAFIRQSSGFYAFCWTFSQTHSAVRSLLVPKALLKLKIRKFAFEV